MNRIAKWDGEKWTALGNGSRSRVAALAIFDDGRGGGPALYAGGRFTDAKGQEIDKIARWDGQEWTALGEGLSGGNVVAMTVFDDGRGPALFVGGGFSHAGGHLTPSIAKWDGERWWPVGGGLSGPYGWVYDLVVQGNEVGSDSLYLGGPFWAAGPNWQFPANRIVEWRGCARPQLDVRATCPSGGTIRIEWRNATPAGQVALIFAREEGRVVIPGGGCAGTRLGLGARQIQVVFTGSAGAEGSRTLNANAGPGACGGYLQLLDLTTCGTSNVARIE
jgi:hypothetical protein